MSYTRVLTTFTQEELELIEQYAATRGIKKATAVKELAIRGLELTTKSTTLTEIDGINQHLCLVDRLVHEQKYLEALKVLKELKQHRDNPNALVAFDKAIKDVSFYASKATEFHEESNRTMNTYLNTKDI